ncbi:beta-ketoacyl synthase N-terminal-like domain-containing protein [Streptomyces sp. NPDC087844]|uniref:beta-ketoacyl synthase N-terminal-like domain-containing protein n=1 Tax=Streptomyces sp. NPDC087844 TaxID=3365805 RepID=UPI0038268692
MILRAAEVLISCRTWRPSKPHSSTGEQETRPATRSPAVPCTWSPTGFRTFSDCAASVVLDSACSSSAPALHRACQSIWSGKPSMAIAGGVNLTRPSGSWSASGPTATRTVAAQTGSRSPSRQAGNGSRVASASSGNQPRRYAVLVRISRSRLPSSSSRTGSWARTAS